VSDEAKYHVLQELRQEYALANLRPIQRRTGVTESEPLELFSHMGKIGGVPVP
jgi:hypothetical protein